MSRLIINPLNKKSKINKEVYGHFSEHLGRGIYEGIFVGKTSDIPNVNGIRRDVVKALKHIKVPVLRWPGGCFADTYQWQDGIGSPDKRKRMINTNWGGVVEDNSFGTHEFLDLCQQVGCEPYITANMGTGSVREMTDWLEYLTSDADTPLTQRRKENGREKPFPVKYWGIGNENWGGGGNMLAQQYAYEYRKYSAFCGPSRLYRIACGANEDDYQWTDTLMKLLTIPAAFHTEVFEGLSMHYYTAVGGLQQKGHATEFGADEYYELLKRTMYMDELLTRHSTIMDVYDPDRRIGLVVDEWGIWHKAMEGENPAFLYQQNTMRDAVSAAVTLNLFNRHSERVVMANLAQMVNVLQSLILTQDDKIVRTPTYHVFDLYKVHQESTLIDSFIETSEIEGMKAIHESASMDEKGNINITVCNLDYDRSRDLDVLLVETGIEAAEAQLLQGRPQEYNTFAAPDNLKLQKMETVITERGVRLMLPPCSVTRLTVIPKGAK